MQTLTVATRQTDLALAQTNQVIAMLKQKLPDIQVKIKKVVTSGDKDKKTALWNLPSTGFFTSQVEQQLLDNKADFAVHSLKDLPTAQPPELTIAAIPTRANPADCIIYNKNINSITDIPSAATIGTSSLRRASQMLHLKNDIKITSVRGNVPTRVDLVRSGKVDAVIVAKAGLDRLNLSSEITFDFNIADFLPAPGQGALAVQCRKDDTQTIEILKLINDKNTSMETAAERQILITTQCGCHGPVGAFAKITNDKITIEAFISDPTGKNLIRKTKTGPKQTAIQTAESLANDLLQAGGKDILEELKK